MPTRLTNDSSFTTARITVRARSGKMLCKAMLALEDLLDGLVSDGTLERFDADPTAMQLQLLLSVDERERKEEGR